MRSKRSLHTLGIQSRGVLMSELLSKIINEKGID